MDASSLRMFQPFHTIGSSVGLLAVLFIHHQQVMMGGIDE